MEPIRQRLVRSSTACSAAVPLAPSDSSRSNGPRQRVGRRLRHRWSADVGAPLLGVVLLVLGLVSAG